MAKYTLPRGLFDILPYGFRELWQEVHLWQYLEKIVRKTAQCYGFEEIRTPLFEQEKVFSIGMATSDIVMKEMYLFEDRKHRPLALRPEGTSAVLRAFFEGGLSHTRKVHKLFYLAPMFRYEKPQKGRYRQHHQFGAEVLGCAAYEQDAEVIDLLISLYRNLGIRELHVDINSVGDMPSREAYKAALLDYLTPQKEALSPESRVRFAQNPLRILDSKAPGDRQLLEGAPSILDFLTPECADHFSGVLATLEELQIPYTVNPKMVRGLDYYQKTVFEIVSSDLGAQNAIGGGGRYDGFPSLFSGQDLPGIGFGTGLERLLQTMLAQGSPIPKKEAPFVFSLPLERTARPPLLRLTQSLRKRGIFAEIALYKGKIQDLLSRAEKRGASYCLIMGAEEQKRGVVRCKEMDLRKEEVVPIQEAASYLAKKWEKR